MSSDTDSDFYGDDETVADLEARVKHYDVANWWALNAQVKMPMRLQALQKSLPLSADATASAGTIDGSMDIDTPSPATAHLHNPYAGVPFAWQLTETVDAFLARLPPSSTPQDERTPWIYICNPHAARRPASVSGQQQQFQVRGGEDEAPVEPGTKLRTFCQGGMERLHMARAFIDQCRQSGMGKAFVEHECAKASKDAAGEVLDLAHDLGVKCGKWMLFRKVEEIDQAWEAIAKATANNELGIAAKVAPRAEEKISNGKSERLICVYTKDFRDVGDVKRVAQKLKQLGLVSPRGLYYKPDAYTYLGIARGNPWGVRASIYDTKTVFKNYPSPRVTRS